MLGLKVKIKFLRKFNLIERKYILVCLNSYISKEETDYFSKKMFNALINLILLKLLHTQIPTCIINL